MQRLKAVSPFVWGWIVFIAASFAHGADYIVAFKKQSDFEPVKSQFYAAPIHGLNNQVVKGLQMFNTDIFMKASLDHLQMIIVESELENAQDLIAQDPRVLAVEKDYFLPGPQPLWVQKLSARAVASAPPKARPWGLDAIAVDGAWSTTRGAGVRVLVIDTGLDRDHPEFTGRVIQGKNFLGRRASDPAPYDYYDDIGHGTHVAGTVLGTHVGVAPEAELLAGRVCGSFGCGMAAITQAIDWGVAESVDVMNLSLGGPCRAGGVAGVAYRNARQAGVVVVAATGNSAEKRAADGSITYVEGVSCPGAFSETIGVGAVASDLKRAGFSQFGRGLDLVAPGVEVVSAVPRGAGRASDSKIDLGSGLEELNSTSFQGSKSGASVSGELRFAHFGKPDDFRGKNFQGQIALIQRGEIFFADKVKNAVAAGATAVVIFNNAPGALTGAITQDGSELSVPVIGILQTDGEDFQSRLAQGQTVKAVVKVDRTDYTAFQGTSMASPHIAGVAALLRAARPGLNLDQVRDILVGTAVDLGDKKGTGAGLVNAEQAVQRALQTTPL